MTEAHHTAGAATDAQRNNRQPDTSKLRPYIDRGWTLIPLQKRSKKPLETDWTKRAYDNNEVVERCAREKLNVGVRLTASQLVVDVDPRNGGDESFERLCRDLGIGVPAWPRVVTGSGGSHRYLTKPADAPVLDSLPAYPGVEFKSVGRQVVAAGSVHPDTGRRYEWDPIESPLAEAPAAPTALLDLIRRPDREAATGGGGHTPDDVAAMLGGLDPAHFREHDKWLQLMMASHHASGGDAREEFLDWSAGDPEYADRRGENGGRWDSLHADAAAGRVTCRTLYKFLADAGRADLIPRPTAEEDFADEPIEDATQNEDGPLDRLNRKFCKVTHGNRVRVMSLERDHDDAGRRHWVSLAKADFALRLSHKTVERPSRRDPTKSVVRPLAGAWLEWRGHRRANGMAFDPHEEPGAVVDVNSEDDGGWLNLWMGWGVEPAEGDWSRLDDMIREVLCRGRRELYDYLIRWLAWKAQNPGEPPEVTVALLGPKGSGKTTLGGEVMAPMFGSHGVVVVSNHQLAGKFSGHMADALFVFADEATWGGDRETESALKQLITDKHRMSEAKGKDAVSVRNRVGLIMAANPGWSVPASLEDRRFLCLDISDHRVVPQDAAPDHPNRLYWNELYRQLDAGGRAAFLHDLLEMDIGDWHPRESVPKTEAQGQQALEGLRDYERFYFESLRKGMFGQWWSDGSMDEDIRPEWSRKEMAVEPTELVQICAEWAAATRRRFNVSPKGLLNALKPFGVRKGKHKQERAWFFPRLDEARRLFAERLGYDPFDDAD